MPRTTPIRTAAILGAALIATSALGPALFARPLGAEERVLVPSDGDDSAGSASTATVASTQPARAVVVDPATTALVAKLGDADAAVRDAAQRDLLQSAADGETLMAALRAARLDAARAADLDVKLRLDTLLVQAQERVDIGPTRISLDVHDAPLWDVLREFNRQAHANFTDPTAEMGGAANMPKVTLALDHVTFWQALKQLQTAARISIYPQGGDQPWRVFRSNSGAIGIAGDDAGAFLTQPSSANYNRSISYQNNGGGANESFNFGFTMFAEPKIRLDAGQQGVLTLDRAVDSNGNNLIGPQRTTSISVGGNGTNVISCNLQLTYPKANPGAKFSELSGTIRVLMARRTQTLSSDDLLAETSPLHIQTAEGVTLSIQAKQPKPKSPPTDAASGDPNNAPAQPDNDEGVTDPTGRTIALTAVIDGGDPAACDRVAQTLQQVHITDPDGVRMTMNNFNQTREAQGHLELRLSFTRNGQERNNVARVSAKTDVDGVADAPKHLKVKLELEVPTSIRQIEVPFVMKDVKMP